MDSKFRKSHSGRPPLADSQLHSFSATRTCSVRSYLSASFTAHHSHSPPVTTYPKQRPVLSPLFLLPPIVSYRQPPKLRNLLVHSKLPSVDNTNFVGPCIVRLCLCCHVMNSDTTIFTPSGTLYAIKGHFKCSFRDLVYMIGYMTGTSAKQVVCWSEESANTEEHRTTAPSFASWSKN